MEFAILKDDKNGKGKAEWKKLEKGIKTDEEEITKDEHGSSKIGFRFEEAVENQIGDGRDVENGYILWELSKNLAELKEFETTNDNKNNMLLDASIALIREKFPRNIIFTQNLKGKFSEEELIRNGFYIFDDGYGIFPPINYDPEMIQTLAEDDSELRNITEKVLKVLEIFKENEKFGRNIFQEQFEPYFWRHCIKEPLFWGLRNASTKFFLEKTSKPITLESFNQGNFLFSSNASGLLHVF